ncbi:MAG: phosphoglucosamine mutase [Acidimicrobiales bacterium]|nr:phosphoglucosamine mutase [Acidimicrobiales bacterium]
MTNQVLHFGTDGVRGRADTELTVPTVRALGRAAAEHLEAQQVFIGCDTRVSSPALAQALAEGFAAGGVTPLLLGVVPTPAVAYLAAQEEVAGAVVSASHNSWHDNGIKLFAAGGHKLNDLTQQAIEKSWHQTPQINNPLPGTWPPQQDTRYFEAVVTSVEPQAFAGLHLVLDCAHGAMSGVAPEAFAQLGAQVTVLHAQPDGRNINENCGSNHPEALQKAVVEYQADAGLAFDGDGDRVVAVAADGSLLDGDFLLAICATDLLEQGRLKGDTLVVTVMANLGLRQAMARRGIKIYETPVGDRHVLVALNENGWVLGGEQSGHIIFADRSTTGDGLLTGIQVIDAARRHKKALGLWAHQIMQKAPQVLLNVTVQNPGDALAVELAPSIEAAQKELGDAGRVVVRPSGTEPLIRVMVEAQEQQVALTVAENLASEVSRRDADLSIL